MVQVYHNGQVVEIRQSDICQLCVELGLPYQLRDSVIFILGENQIIELPFKQVEV